jgi:hypothetical protein
MKAKIPVNMLLVREVFIQYAKMEVANAKAVAKRMDADNIVIMVVLTWVRTWGLSLKSQKIRTSYEMGWLERNRPITYAILGDEQFTTLSTSRQ